MGSHSLSRERFSHGLVPLLIVIVPCVQLVPDEQIMGHVGSLERGWPWAAPFSLGVLLYTSWAVRGAIFPANLTRAVLCGWYFPCVRRRNRSAVRIPSAR